MTPEIVAEYKRILGNLLNVMVAEQLDSVRSMLDRIPDDAADLRAAIGGREPPAPPPHWISILRIARFAIALRAEAQANYNAFVQSYQDLSALPERDPDQMDLVKELSDVLYATDETFGTLDRLLAKLLEDSHRLLAARHGMQMEPDEAFYRSEVAREDRLVIQPIVQDLMNLCREILEHLRVMSALDRVRLLIEKHGGSHVGA